MSDERAKNLKKLVSDFKKRVGETQKRSKNNIAMPDNFISETQKLASDIEEICAEMSKDQNEFVREAEGMKKEYEKLHAEYLALQREPYYFSHFIRFVRSVEIGGKYFPLIEVDSGGQRSQMLIVNEKVNPSELKYGQKLIRIRPLMGVEHIIDKTDEFPSVGEEAFIEEVLIADEEAPRVSVRLKEIGDKSVLRVCGRVDPSRLTAGAKVLVDTRISMVVDVLTDAEAKNKFKAIVPDVKLDDIGGLERIIEEIREDFVWPAMYPELFTKMRVPETKSLLLVGPPGCGKTMIGKSIAHLMAEEAEKKYGLQATPYFVYVKVSDILHWFLGMSEHKVNEYVEDAEKLASPQSPVVIFIDEFDALGRVRGSGISSDFGDTLGPQFNEAFEKLASLKNVTLVLASNRPDLIDPAIIRAGRIYRQIYVPRPGVDGAKAILAKYLQPDMVHPRYVVDVYTPTDRQGRPRRDTAGDIIRSQFKSDRAKVVEYLIEKTANRMFDKQNPANEFIRIKYEGEAKSVLRYGNFVNGAMIKNVVERAAMLSIGDHIKRGAEPGIELSHLYAALEQVFSELRLRFKQRGRGWYDWLAIEGYADKNIDPESLPEVVERGLTKKSDGDEEAELY